jgi:hypothetical protein
LTDRRLIVLLLLFAGCLRGQVLLPTPETAFEQQHNFNRAFIKAKGIKKITFDIVDKKDFEVPVDKSLTETYEFDAEGRISRYYYTTITKTIERQITSVGRKGKKKVTSTRTIKEFVYDTVSTNYFYAGDRLILKRYHDGVSYYEGKYFRYDSAGNVTREQRYRETNNSPDRSYFVLGNQVLLSEDSFQYTRYSTGQLKCLFLNNEHRPYKQKITNFDSLGRKVSVSELYTAAAWITQEQAFLYKESRLMSARFSGNAGNKVVLVNVYEYDEHNELYGEKHYKNDVLTKEVSYVSDRLTNLLNSFVIRDHINKTMRIVKLRYDLGMIGSSGNGNRY